eukprot:TRINITY_DN4091_c0_g1_i3.p2 TRINITY_DN4091_c0_g1~~TRINITY_DN4091_c0_g1_i3.p2  ORF type:complete len:167 (-),score=90.93 TRINITY_DN4091_c0_g1_i3:46-546(-)
MIRRPPRSTQSRSSAASDVYKRQLQSLIKEIEQIEKELDAVHDKSKNEQQEVGPAINTKRDEFLKQIEDLKQKKKDLSKEWDKAWDDYYAQQDEIKQIEWMTKVKGRLLRDEQRKKRDEERRKRDEEELKLQEEEKKKFHPYQEEMDLCTSLITCLLYTSPSPRDS